MLLCLAEGVLVLSWMIVSEWNIDSVPDKGCICLSQGLNGEPRKMTCGNDFFGINSSAPKTATWPSHSAVELQEAQ